MMKRLRVLLAAAFVLLKLAAVLSIRASPEGPQPLMWLIVHDRPSLWAADVATALVFDQRRLGPTVPEGRFFEWALLASTAIEWYTCGFVIERLLKWIQRRAGTRSFPERGVRRDLNE
jgi:hypothetical protein